MTALPDRTSTVVIGGGQAGLSVGYHLQQREVPFVILDAGERVGDAWRHRWDSLRLFTPAQYCGLDGLPFPAPAHTFPTKDEMADYLESYTAHFELPVHNGMRVERLTEDNGRYLVEANGQRIAADSVVVAMSSWQQPRRPAFAADLDGGIRQVHSSAYRNPGQLQEGPVLVIGAGNSGAEIALETAKTHRTILAGPDVGHVPFDIESRIGRLMVPVVLRFLYHRVLTTSTPMGRKARKKKIASGEPLVRTKPKDLAAAGVERVGRVTGVRGGLPVLDDGEVAEVGNVVWCTGFTPGFSWIDLPVHDEDTDVRHHRGVVDDFPGLYFVGLKFLHAISSAQIHGVGRDADRIADLVAARERDAEVRAGRPAVRRSTAS
jgi:putative flavoprotein involved in K+ transport